MLWTYPEDGLGRRLTGPNVPPLDDDSAREWENLLKRLLGSSPKDVDNDGSFVPHLLRFSSEALEILHAFEREIEVQLGPDGHLSGVQHWSGKLVGNTVRIAALLHLALTAENIVADLWGVPISRWAMESATSLARALTDHALKVFETLEADPKKTLAQHLLARAIQLPEGGTERDLFNLVRKKKGLGTMGQMRAVFEVLEDHELARLCPQPNTGAQGRPASPVIEINPQITGIGPHNPHNPPESRCQGDSAENVDINQGGRSCPDPDEDPDGFERWCIESEEDA